MAVSARKSRKPKKHPGGRPSDYNQPLADRICEQLSLGKSMRTVCKAEDIPSPATLFSWMRKYPQFLEQYTRAKQESADALVDEMQDIADDAVNDWMKTNDPDNPGYKINGEHIQRSRLRVETRKWCAAKLKPKKYGDKIEHEHSGKLTLEQLVSASLDSSK